jgi:hypothetical protein
MPQHVWSVLCQKGILDQFSNQVTLLDVVENLSIETYDDAVRAARDGKQVVIPIKIHLVSMWARGDFDVPETFISRHVLVLPDGTEIAPDHGTRAVDLVQYRRIRQFVRIEGFRFIGAGVYRFLIQWRASDANEWATVGNVPFDVELKVVPEAPPDARVAKGKKNGKKKAAS